MTVVEATAAPALRIPARRTLALALVWLVVLGNAAAIVWLSRVATAS